MELKEAILKSKGSPIAREKWENNFAIIPTDDIEACICLSKNKKTVPRWNPSKEDFIADDWVVTEMDNSIERREKMEVNIIINTERITVNEITDILIPLKRDGENMDITFKVEIVTNHVSTKMFL